MKLPVVSLRILLPGVVTLFALALLSALLWQSLHSASERVIAQATAEVWAAGSELQQELDGFGRRGDFAGIAGAINRTGADGPAECAALVGADGTVLAANRAEWAGRPVATLPDRFVPPPDVRRPRAQRAPGTDVIVGFFPVDPDGTGPSKSRGVLVFALDAARPAAAARSQVWGRFLVLALGSLALAVVLGVTLNHLVSRRVGALQQTVARIAAGDFAARPTVDGGDELGELAQGLALMTDRLHTASVERDRANRLLMIQNEVLAAVADDAPLGSVLDLLCRLVEHTHERSLCSVMALTEGRLHFVAGADLGPAARAWLNGLVPGPQAGSCGTAAHTGCAVFVSDTRTDPRWEGLRDVARELGIRACWSVPITDQHAVYGTFAVSHLVPREPDERDRELLAACARLAEIAVRRARTQGELRASEERLRLVIDAEPACVKLVAPDGTLLQMNPAGLALIEAPAPGVAVGRSVFDLVAPEDRERFRALHARVCAGAEEQAEFRIVGLGGHPRWVSTHAVPFRPPGATAAHHLAVTRDVTERHKAEAALRESEERFRLLAETIDEVFWMRAPDLDRLLYVSPAYERLWGHPRADLDENPQAFLDAIHPDDRPGVLALFSPGGARWFRAEYRVVRPDGVVRWVEDRGFPVREPDGRLRVLVGCVRDVTERKLAEEALRAREARFRAVVETTPDGFWMVDARGRITEVNEAYARRSGYTRAELLGMSTGAVEVAEDPAALEARFAALRRAGHARFESVHRAKDGTLWPVEVTTAAWPETGGAFAFLRDVTDRKRAEDRVRRATELLQAVADGAPDAIFVKDRAGKYLLFNEAAARFVGRPVTEVLGRDDTELFEPDSARQVREHDLRVMETGAAAIAEETLTAAGTTRTYLAKKAPYRDGTGKVVGLIGVSTDITDRKRTERRLRMLEYSVEHAADAVFWVAPDARILYANRAAGERTNPSPGSGTWSVFDFDPDTTPSEWPALWCDMKERGSWVIERRHHLADGRVVPVEITGSYVNFDGSEFQFASVRDISDRKRSEHALRESEAKFRGLYEASGDAIFLLQNDRFIDCNSRALEMYGCQSRDQIVGQPPYRFSPPTQPDGRDSTESAREKIAAARAGTPLRFEWTHTRLDGTLFPAEVSLNAVEFGGEVLLQAIVQDISDRKRAEQAVRDSEERFRALVEYGYEGINVLSPTGWSVYSSPKNAALVGLEEGAVDDDAFGFVHPDDRPRARAALAEALASPGQVFNLHVRLVRKDGTVFWAEAHARNMLDHPAIRGVVVNWRDVTDRHLAEAALRESEERFRAVVESVPTGLAAVDRAGRIVLVNQRVLERFGYTREELLGQPVEVLVPDRYRDAHLPQRERYLSAPTPRPMGGGREQVAVRKDGTEFPVEIGLVPMASSSEALVLAAVADITERKRAEAEIRELNEDLERRVAERTAELSRLVTILEASPDFIAIAEDPAVGVLFSNAAFRRLAAARGLAPGQINLPNFHTPESVRKLLEEGLPAAARDGVWVGETDVLGPGGQIIPVSQSLQAHKGPDGRVQYLSTIMRDISDRKRLEDELRHRRDALLLANAELAKASRLKDEFLASMSHELRTPLNGVLATSEALQEEVYGPVTPQQTSALRDIEQCGRHLLALINDILDLSKVEAGQITLDVTPVDVEAVCQAALRLVKEMAQKKRHRVSFSCDGSIGKIAADERRLKQILVNLLSNAVKFTPDGGAVGLEVRGDEAGGTVSFAVSDTGIGIRAEDLGLLFRPFQQIDSRLSREYSGTGLGLALVRRMTELHGGSVTVDSRPGHGSRFKVSLPWQPAADEEELAPGRPPRVRKVLLVEDSPGDAEQLGRYLADLNVEAVVHPGATGALDRVRGERPDLVLLDLLLPDGDGWALLGALKAAPDLTAIPVVVMSVVDDRSRCLELGAVAHLVKPLDRDTLRAALRQSARAAEGSREGPPLPARPDPTAPLLLLAEDNPINARSAHDYLQSAGYRVAVAANGFQALDRARELRPALVLMDIQMPGIDGLEVIRRLRADESTRAIPVIAVTALAMPGDRDRCLAAGADDYLMKPLSLRQLLEQVWRFAPLGGAPTGQ